MLRYATTTSSGNQTMVIASLSFYWCVIFIKTFFILDGAYLVQLHCGSVPSIQKSDKCQLQCSSKQEKEGWQEAQETSGLCAGDRWQIAGVREAGVPIASSQVLGSSALSGCEGVGLLNLLCTFMSVESTQMTYLDGR